MLVLLAAVFSGMNSIFSCKQTLPSKICNFVLIKQSAGKYSGARSKQEDNPLRSVHKY